MVLIGVKYLEAEFQAIKKADLRRLFLLLEDCYFAAGAAGAATAEAAAGAGAAAGASATGAGLLQATKVTAKTAAIRAERVILSISLKEKLQKMANP